MVVYFLDYENGNDANNGTTFAQRWRTFTSGATAARIAPGDEIRVMASPDFTLIGSATWNGTPKYGSGAGVAITSSTNATPIVITRGTPTDAAPEVQTGDWVYIQDHTTNTRANGLWKATRISATQFSLDGSVGNGVGGATGTFRIVSNSIVELSSTLTQNIACIGNRATLTNWSSAANVTCTINTADFKEGGECQQIALAAGFTTGRAAWLPTGTLNLSGFQQVSFWIKQTAGTVATNGQISLRLCTDTAGNTSVHTITVPALAALNRWTRVTVDLATNLNSAIQSVALYVETDLAAQTFLLDNIIACRAASSNDSLSLSSLIGKSTTGANWYSIGSLTGTTVSIETESNSTWLTGGRAGYGGTSETVSTYKRETIKVPRTATSAGAIETFQDSGTTGSLITVTGGWNRTDMSTQTGETWFDGQNGHGHFLTLNSRSNLSFSRLGLVNFAQPFTHSGGNQVNISFTDCRFNQMLTGLQVGGTTSGMNFTNCLINGMITNGLNGDNNIFTNCLFENTPNFQSVQVAICNGLVFENCTFRTNNGVGNGSITLGAGTGRCDNNIFMNCTFTKSTIGINATSQNNNKFYDCTISNVREGIVTRSDGLVFRNTTFSNIGLRNTTFTLTSATADMRVYSEKENGVSGSRIYSNVGQVNTDSTTRQSGSGISWRLTATSSAVDRVPLKISIAKIACRANSLVTFSAWLRRANAASTVRLRVPKLQLSGITSDVTASMTAAINTWQQVSLTFTPTEAGVVEVFVETFGSTSDTWIDNLTVSQAP